MNNLLIDSYVHHYVYDALFSLGLSLGDTEAKALSYCIARPYRCLSFELQNEITTVLDVSSNIYCPFIYLVGTHNRNSMFFSKFTCMSREMKLVHYLPFAHTNLTASSKSAKWKYSKQLKEMGDWSLSAFLFIDQGKFSGIYVSMQSNETKGEKKTVPASMAFQLSKNAWRSIVSRFIFATTSFHMKSEWKREIVALHFQFFQTVSPWLSKRSA